MKLLVACVAACWLLLQTWPPSMAGERGKPWTRHVIDGSSRGADGARLADVNGDGLPDIATGWEEGSQIRVCLHPGVQGVREPWPAVTVGRVKSPEDAVFADVNGDGALDVVSSCEGSTRSIYFHVAPSDANRYLDASAWQTHKLPAAAGKTRWMFCLPMDVDGRGGIDLVVGSKAPAATVAWLEAPAQSDDLHGWKLHPIMDAAWVMSLVAADVDGDGRQDVIVSDRKGDQPGVYWLQSQPDGPGLQWARHAIGGLGQQVMFLDYADLNGDGVKDVLVAISGGDLLYLRRDVPEGQRHQTATKPDDIRWSAFTISMPENVGGGKSVRVGDINLDGKMDLVLSCESANGDRSGVVWMEYNGTPEKGSWQTHELSGTAGVKFDLLQLVDLDGDGDLDVITCEERDNLGLIWYENPTRSK